jgi:predicted anti-sigma-YlaC factor YlaD
VGDRWLRSWFGIGGAGLLVAALAGCSVRTYAVNQAGKALASGGSTWSADDDPELIRDASPFALKTMESLLAASPKNPDLLLAACSGFTQYAYAFIQNEADMVEATDLPRAQAMRARAERMYRRALGYGLRGLELAQPGVAAQLRRDPEAAVAKLRDKRQVPLMYWTAAAWGGAIALDKLNTELSADLPAVGALIHRAVALDPGFDDGALYDLLIAWDGGRPAAAGGSIAAARRDFATAVAYAHGRCAAPFVTMAETVAVAEQNRAEFQKLLGQALAVNADAVPEQRLANLIAQKRARWLLSRTDELFIE